MLNHRAIVQPRLFKSRLCDCSMVTQVTLNTEPGSMIPQAVRDTLRKQFPGHWRLDTWSLAGWHLTSIGYSHESLRSRSGSLISGDERHRNRSRLGCDRTSPSPKASDGRINLPAQAGGL